MSKLEPEAAVDATGGRRQSKIGGRLDGVGVRFAENNVVEDSVVANNVGTGRAGRDQVLMYVRIGAVHEL